VANTVYEKNKNKPREICTTLQPRAWGYNKSVDGQHASPDEVMQMLNDARAMNANLLLNIGPKADGSIPGEDVAILTEVGKRLKLQR
jgi:alpha-L-fucosidase